MVNKKYITPLKTGKCGKYKYLITSGHDTGVTIFIKKRMLGFLWWTLVKDQDNCPITYNHFDIAESFMLNKIKYNDMLHYLYDYNDKDKNGFPKRTVVGMTDELAWDHINEFVYRNLGEKAEIECVKRAWELDKKRYCHVAADYAILWHQIYKGLGKKSWEN